MSRELVYENLVAELLQRVPVFARERERDDSFISHDDDSPYLVFGDLGRFLVDVITGREHQAEREEIVAASFRLLDEMATSRDDFIVNVAETTVFENLCDLHETTAVAREHLSKEGVRSFNRAFTIFGYK